MRLLSARAPMACARRSRSRRPGEKSSCGKGSATIGGSCRSAELTLPGFTHDICSTVQALARVSPFIKSLKLERFGLELLDPPAPMPIRWMMEPRRLPNVRSKPQRKLSAWMARVWQDRLRPFVDSWEPLAADLLAPMGIPRHPFLMARFGLHAIRSAEGSLKVGSLPTTRRGCSPERLLTPSFPWSGKPLLRWVWFLPFLRMR